MNIATLMLLTCTKKKLDLYDGTNDIVVSPVHLIKKEKKNLSETSYKTERSVK